MESCRRKDIEFVKFCVSAGADVNHTDKYLLTPLAVAAVSEAFDCFKFLIDSGANPHSSQWVSRREPADGAGAFVELSKVPPREFVVSKNRCSTKHKTVSVFDLQPTALMLYNASPVDKNFEAVKTIVAAGVAPTFKDPSVRFVPNASIARRSARCAF